MCKDFWKNLFGSTTKPTKPTEPTEENNVTVHEYNCEDEMIKLRNQINADVEDMIRNYMWNINESVDNLKEELYGAIDARITDLDKQYNEEAVKVACQVYYEVINEYMQNMTTICRAQLIEATQNVNKIYEGVIAQCTEYINKLFDQHCGCKSKKDDKKDEEPEAYRPRFLGFVRDELELSDMPYRYQIQPGDYVRAQWPFEVAWQEGEPDETGRAYYAKIEAGDFLVASTQFPTDCALNIEDSYFQYWSVIRPTNIAVKER